MLGESKTLTEAPEGRSRPSAEEVRAQLSRINDSDDFPASTRDRKFLHYIIDETLAGRHDRIKAYSIATEVFGRNQNFDAQSDPVVRIEAGRLRRALERYYLGAGQADPILIEVPKGGYVPTFSWRSTTPPANPTREEETKQESAVSASPSRRGRAIWLALGSACALILVVVGYMALSHIARTPSEPANPTKSAPAARPLVIVVPFADLGEGQNSRLYATGLTEEVLSQLARFSELSVLGRDTSNSLGPSADIGRVHRELGIRYAIEGSVRVSEGRLRASVRLLDAVTGAVLWSGAYDEDLGSRDFLAIQSDVAQKVATTLAQPYGVIFRTDHQQSQPPDDPEAYACTSQYYTYRSVRSSERHAALRSCMERTVARFPRFSTAWAMLSFLYLDEDRFGFNRMLDSPKALERATDAARRAVALNSEEVRGLQALMMSLFLSGEHNEALQVGQRALELNPNDTELLGELGSRTSLAGDWERGAALVERARALNPAHAGFYNGTLALCAYMLGDYERAASLIRQTTVDRYPFYHLVAAITYGQLGSHEANEHRMAFLHQRPEFLDNWQVEWARRVTRSEDRAHLDQGARKAGFKIP
ncbi:MAG TPA: adenylate cyclase [Microvirga sp.]|jgi:TolB-like protein|nr:adenylate cyclase [Microvirga sp.]